MKSYLVFTIAFILSIIFHLALFKADIKLFKSPVEGKRLVEVKLLPMSPGLLKALTDKVPKEDLQQKQIVQTDGLKESKEAKEDAKYLSEKNHIVKEEMKAKKIADFKNAKNAKGKEENMAAMLSKAQKELAEVLEHPEKEHGEMDKPINKMSKIKKGISMKDLMPKASELVGLNEAGGVSDIQSANDDYLKDVKEGDENMLNTKEFVFYSYYARIKEQIKRLWQSKIYEKVSHIYKRGRSIASDLEKVTKLMIIMDKSGNILNIEVLSTSGTPDFDSAAIEAFREAEPFPNPPAGLIDNNGNIRLRWDFIVNTGSGAGVKIEYSYL